MNNVLWIVQGLLATAYAAAGLLKLGSSRQKLHDKGMTWTLEFSDRQVRLIGLAELMGAIGLVAPQLSGLAPILTPLAAVCLVLVMVGAVKTHLRHKESPLPPLVLAALCVFVALGRFGLIG